MPTTSPGDHHGQGDAPRQVGHPHAVVGGQRRQRQVFLVQPLPVADTRKDERPRRGGDKPRQESPDDRRRGNRTAHGNELEQHDRRRERASEQRRYGREGSGQHEQLCLRLLEAHEPNGDHSHPQAEGDERRLRPEHEPEAEGRQAREQDAGQLDGLNRRRRDPLERRVAAVAREAQEQRHEHARERRHEDHVPPGRLAPVQPVRDDLPDEVDDVVDRGLEEHGRDRDREAEESR